MKIGITERGDAALDTSWLPWVKKGEPAILISKNPNLLFSIIKENDLLDKPNYIVHCTITGMGGSVVEPHVEEPEFQITSYLDFVRHIGSERTVLRIDPIVPTKTGIETAVSVAKKAKGRVRISFLDMYDHVKERLKQADISIPYESFHAPYEMRREAWYAINAEVCSLEVCGEPMFECTGCVSSKDLQAMKIDYVPKVGGLQRQFCCCIAEKYELLKNKTQCSHQCLYCYYGKYEKTNISKKL